MHKWIFESVRLPSKQDVARRFIEQNFDEIDEMIDENGCSLLHIAADGNNLEIMQYLLIAYQQHAQADASRFSPKHEQEWINRKNTQGFTAIHYAVFRHNFKMVLLLEKKGADVYKVNNEGLNCLLLAAQGGSPLLMYYFMGKGSSIGFTDVKGNTALHWASYMAMENAVEALISWGAQIDRQDQANGMTPLHLAVLSGSSQVVKKLLLGGCDRTIKSKTGQSAYDLAIQRSYTQIASMIMDKMGLLSLLNLQSRFSRSSRRSFPFYCFIFLFLTTYLINIAYLIPFSGQYSSIMAVIGLGIGLVVAVQFILLALSNPGKIASWSKDLYFQMLKENHPSKICFYCDTIKPLRSRHCYICNICVQVYDHHCPWIGNCVGSNNYFAFFMFIVSILIYMGYSTAYHIANLVLLEWDANKEMVVVLTFASCYNLFICSLFSLPIIYLFIVQMDNCCQNKTTYQKYSRRTNKNMTRLKELVNLERFSERQLVRLNYWIKSLKRYQIPPSMEKVIRKRGIRMQLLNIPDGKIVMRCVFLIVRIHSITLFKVHDLVYEQMYSLKNEQQMLASLILNKDRFFCIVKENPFICVNFIKCL